MKRGLLPLALAAVAFASVLPARAAAPPNDDFGAAKPLGLPGSDLVYNLDATLQSGEPSPCGSGRGSVWYRYTAAADGPVVAGASAESNFAPSVAVYTGSALGSLTLVGCRRAVESRGGAGVPFQAVSGTAYLIQASATASGYGWLRASLAPFTDGGSETVAAPACAPLCPYVKSPIPGGSSDPESACAAPGAIDRTVSVPSGVSHLWAGLSPEGDQDLFLCRAVPDAHGKRFVARSVNALSISLPASCVSACPEGLFAPVEAGAAYVVRVFDYAGGAPGILRRGFASGL